MGFSAEWLLKGPILLSGWSVTQDMGYFLVAKGEEMDGQEEKNGFVLSQKLKRMNISSSHCGP